MSEFKDEIRAFMVGCAASFVSVVLIIGILEVKGKPVFVLLGPVVVAFIAALAEVLDD
jgi:hypothetical protein